MEGGGADESAEIAAFGGDAAGASSSSSLQPPRRRRYPRIADLDDEPDRPPPPPPPVLQSLFPHADDPPLTAGVKLLNICTGGAAVLATARGLIAAATAGAGTGLSRSAAFRRGVALTFPIYLPAFCLGAAADHMLRRSGGKQRTFEHDLP